MMKMEKKIWISLIFLFLVGAISMQAFAATTPILSSTGIMNISLINQNPDPANAGDTVDLRVSLQNLGSGSINNVVFEFIPDYPFTLVPGQDAAQTIGTIQGYQYGGDSQVVKVKLLVDRDATSGNYDLKVKEYQEGHDELSVTKTISIAVGNRQSAEVIYINQVELIPGKITPMNFTIHNVGSAPLKDLTFFWENTGDIILPVGSDNTRYIKYLDVGDKVNIGFNVIASATATPNLYKLDLTLDYNDANTGATNTITSKAGVYVGGATDFDVTFSGTSNGDSSFSIANIGSVSASSVTVSIPNQPNWKVTGSNSVIIGNLNEGDYTVASFKIQPIAMQAAGNQSSISTTQGTRQRPTTFGNMTSRNTSGRNMTRLVSQTSNIKINIMYTDSRGNRIPVTKEVYVDTSVFGASTSTIGGRTAAASTSSTLTSTISKNIMWIIIGLVVVISLIIINKRHKRGMLKDPDYSYSQTISDIFRKKKTK